MIAMAAAVGISRFVYTPILPVMVAALDLSRTQAGLIASANFLGYLAGALLAGAARLPGSRQHWLVAALLVSAITTAAMGAVDTMAGFLLLRGIGGAASAFVLVLATTLVLEQLAVARRLRLSALHFAGVGIGIAISAVVVSACQGSGADWRQLWFVVGAIGLAAAVVVAVLIPASDHWQAAPVHATRRARRPGIAWLAGAYGLFGFGYVITATFLVAIVRASPRMHGVETLVWLIVGLTAAASVALWTWLGNVLGIRRAYSLACLLEAGGVLASVLLPSTTGALLAATLLGGTFMGLTALGLAQARILAADNPRPVLALMTAAFGVGQVIGPSVAGYLSDQGGSFLAPSLLAAAALGVAAILVQGARPPAAL
jgi:predicted MFS family arabinose efflux permease